MLTKDDIIKVIESERNIISNNKGEIIPAITSENSLYEIGLSSLEIVQLLVSLEDIYEVEFTHKFNEISEIITYILDRGKCSERN